MINECNIEDIYLSSTPIIDVRSPGEYAKGHIPRAVNIPLFTNDERAHVGTVYKQQSKENAVKLGYKYVTPKLQWFIDESLKVSPNRDVIVHCWRGGMRSQSFAQHLLENSFTNVQLLSGGYKAYRRFVLGTFEKKYHLHILGGYTGSGKTYILHELKKLGEQVIDLEGLANHKGSAFGGIDQPQQPTVEQFENNLHEQWLNLDPHKPIWLEDESHNIGADKIPMPLFLQMRDAHLFFLDVPKAQRAKHLVAEYAICNKEELAISIHRIAKRLGYQNEKMAIEMLEQENFFDVALITLHYYDKSYLKGISTRKQEMVHTIEVEDINHKKNSETILKYLNKMDTIKLTQYSHGAGCGCKISPKVLSTILETKTEQNLDANLLVGNDSRDDAAVYDLGNGQAIISTTDFFMPIVDDPFMFGRIAAANAISDVYAMGGKPLMAIAILGWPVDKIPAEVAQRVLEGGREACKEAGITLAGGHSIDSPEPIFGLAVTGQVETNRIKRNDTATKGCHLLLTKPLGVGVFTTAQKQGKLKDEHQHIAPHYMAQLNKIGQQLSKSKYIKAMTDVTGFGLLGHLTEMCEGSNLSADIDFAKIPRIDGVDYYIEQNCLPGGTHRNWDSYGHSINLQNEQMKPILCDPQTSGGLLIAVEDEGLNDIKELLKSNGITAEPFGRLKDRSENLINVV